MYFDLGFLARSCSSQFGATGQFAQAYILAHEAGHHLQKLLGHRARRCGAQQQREPEQANALSVRLELQADCYRRRLGKLADDETNGNGIALTPADVDEALTAAAAVGDDRIQKAAGRAVDPESLDPRLGRAARAVVLDAATTVRRPRPLRHLQPLTPRDDVDRGASGRRSAGQTLKPRARSCSRPSSVILSGPHGGIHTQLMRTSPTRSVERRVGLVLDDVGERAGRGGQRHVEHGDVVLVDRDAVDQAEVDDVDPELGVDDVAASPR